MGYSIRKLPNKSKLPHWKRQFISYKKPYSNNSIAKKPRKKWDICRSRWQTLGFHESMNLDQAKSRGRQLNAQLEIRKQEEKRRSLEEEELFFKTKFMAAMPEVYKDEFEKKYLSGRYRNPGWERRFWVAWRASQRMLAEVQCDPLN